MTDQHLITPPPELIQQLRISSGTWLDQITNAYQAGTNDELEACCEEMKSLPSPLGIPFGAMASNALRAARRPKPPTLKEQAQAELDRLIALIPTEGAMAMAEPIRKALEALPND